VLVGIALAPFGLAPRFARASWGVLAACVVLGQLGRLLQLAPWAMDLSPFTHVPKLPDAEPRAGSELRRATVPARWTHFAARRAR
jgi:ABC-2 type transport system permease protein